MLYYSGHHILGGQINLIVIVWLYYLSIIIPRYSAMLDIRIESSYPLLRAYLLISSEDFVHYFVISE